MSSWLVDREHIDLIVDVAQRGPIDAQRGDWSDYYTDPDAAGGMMPATDSDHRVIPDALGRLLWAENLTGVSARYPSDGSGHRPGPSGLEDAEIAAYTFTRRAYRMTALEAIHALGCLEYQSCDSDTYRQSAAAKWNRELVRSLAQAIPGERGPWGWDAEEIAKRSQMIQAATRR